MVPIPVFPLPEGADRSAIDAVAIAKEWLAHLATSFNNGFDGIERLFIADGWWKDILALSWDFRTLHGLSPIQAFLEENHQRNAPFHFKIIEEGKLAPHIKDLRPLITTIQAVFEFENSVGHGRGVVQLVRTDEDAWKAWMAFTRLEGLKEDRDLSPEKTTNRLDSDGPTVVIIGAGQFGLGVAVRLKTLNIPYVIVDKGKQVGDSWRTRYSSLKMHTGKGFDHLPLLPFPEDWPPLLLRDHLVEWMERYATHFQLNVLLDKEVIGAEYDDANHQWTLHLRSSENNESTLRPHHVILATGMHSGFPHIPTFPHQDSFKGQLYHTSLYEDASKVPDVSSKKVVIVGSGTSGHDICKDFCLAGADVTMIQRGPMWIFTGSVAQKGQFSLVEPGLSIEDNDLLSISLPHELFLQAMREGNKDRLEADKELIEGVEKQGFAVAKGEEDGKSWGDNVFERGGHFYIEHGASQLIAEGKIKVKRCPEGIKEFTEDGIVLADDSKLDADIVILATGYESMNESVRQILGDKVAKRVNPIWGINEETELRAVWRKCGHPGLWIGGGNFAWTRQKSNEIALQIEAIQRGYDRDD